MFRSIKLSHYLMQSAAALLVAGLAAQSQAQDQDGAQSETIVSEGRDYFATCSGCHAIPALSNAYPTYNIPRVGGQHQAYVVDALTAYATDSRDHQTMKANAVNLTGEMKSAIGAFLEQATRSSDNGNYIKGNPAAGQELVTSCAACHGPEGLATEGGNFPKLAGQYESYLYFTLKAYQDGSRQNAVMNAQITDDMSDADLRNIAAFYADKQDLGGALTTVEFEGGN